ncbi:MAG: signal peptidase I [Burkholderiales bacterium]|nr:signal peptidase I [Burkholderiales bacterium]
MNFALILFLLLLLTGAVAAADRFHFARRRAAGAREPWWIEYPKSFFPVILIVFMLRSFLVEPFKIPSGSMIPTLLVGDFILVNKFTYGIRLPIVNLKVFDVGSPHRGDVMVFRYPEDPSLDYIKRVIGLPGDTVTYYDKRLAINGKVLPVRPDGDYQYLERRTFARQYIETIGGREHRILLEDDAASASAPPFVMQFPFRENCTYNTSGLTCTVPPNHYFLMGDNRDNSSDSRVWGFVPDANIVGKAFFIWFNFGEPRRIGTFQ